MWMATDICDWRCDFVSAVEFEISIGAWFLLSGIHLENKKFCYILLINILCGFDCLNRILSCFKLNPFEYLNLPFDSSIGDVKKQYRKVTWSFSWGLF